MSLIVFTFTAYQYQLQEAMLSKILEFGFFPDVYCINMFFLLNFTDIQQYNAKKFDKISVKIF